MASTTDYSIDDLLRRANELEASDLHVTPGSEPVVRIRGRIERLDEFEKLTPEVTRELVYRILSTEQQKTLETKRSVDLAYSLPGVARFRVNVVLPAPDRRRRVPHDPERDQVALGARASAAARRRSRRSRAASSSSPARPAPVSRRRSRR